MTLFKLQAQRKVMCSACIYAFSAIKETEGERLTSFTQLTVYLGVVSLLAFLQPGFKPCLFSWPCNTGRCNSQCFIFYHYIITNSSLLVITKCTLTYALQPAVLHSPIYKTQLRLRLINLSLSQGWKTKPTLKKTYTFFLSYNHLKSSCLIEQH